MVIGLHGTLQSDNKLPVVHRANATCQLLTIRSSNKVTSACPRSSKLLMKSVCKTLCNGHETSPNTCALCTDVQWLSEYAMC